MVSERPGTWTIGEMLEFRDEFESVYHHPVGYLNSSDKFFLWAPVLSGSMTGVSLSPKWVWESFWDDERQRRCEDQDYPEHWQLIVEEWTKHSREYIKLPNEVSSTQQFLELLYKLQFSRSVKLGRIPEQVIKELHSLVWGSIGNYDGRPTPLYDDAFEVLNAVVAKAQQGDRDNNPAEAFPAIMKYLQDGD